MSNYDGLLRDLSPYVYGTTRLGDGSIPFEERVKVARAVMDSGVWMHTSHQYGDALKVLRTAFDQDRSKVPHLIFKIGWESPEQIRGQVLEQIEALDIPSMSIGQLCLGGGVAEDLRAGGPGIEGLLKLKEEGLVDRFVLETWPWSSQIPIDAITAGHADRLLDGLIFYLNPLQRFVSNDLWDLVRERSFPVVAMRTVAGGSLNRLLGSSDAPEYLRRRAPEVLPLYERSGCSSWPEFSLRYVYGFPEVRTSVGATSKMENLRQFLEIAPNALPLPQDIQSELEQLQRKWFEEHDRYAEPWSM